MPAVVEAQASIIAEKKVYENPELGNHVGTITRVEDLGIKKHDLYGDQHRVKIHIRIDDEKTSKDETMYVSQTCTLSLGEKARLGKFLRQLGIPTDGNYDLANLVPMKINLGIVYAKVGNNTYANVEWVSPIRKRSEAASTEV